MRTLLLFLLIGIFSCSKESVEKPDDGNPKPGSISIPDSEFEKRLIELKIDSDQKVNGSVSLSDTKNVDSLKLRSIENSKFTQIKSLKGIEHFPNLVYLDCLGNDIDSLDLSQNKKLKWLNCSGYRLDVGGILEQQVIYLNISENMELEELYTGLSYLKKLDISKHQKLRKAEFGGSVAEVDVSHNLNLTSLKIEGVWMLNLDVSKNTLLKELSLIDTKISSLNLLNNDKLEKLYCPRNKLRSLDLKNAKQLKELDCSYNELAELNLTGLGSLTKLEVSNNNDFKGRSINQLDLSTNLQLKELQVNNIAISSVDLSNNTLIERLTASGTAMKTIDLNNLINLKYLMVGFSKIAKLDLKNNKKLESLDCTSTEVEILDLSNNENITRLLCSTNPNLKQLDISKCKKLDLLQVQATANLKSICVFSLAEASAKANWKKDQNTEYKICS